MTSARAEQAKKRLGEAISPPLCARARLLMVELAKPENVGRYGKVFAAPFEFYAQLAFLQASGVVAFIFLRSCDADIMMYPRADNIIINLSLRGHGELFGCLIESRDIRRKINV